MSLPPVIQSLSESLKLAELTDEAAASSALDNAFAAPLGSSLRPAAVLVLLYRRPHGIVFPLTIRLDSLTHHPGQVSLPGGRIDAEDQSGWDAALRETREELGVRTGRVRALGALQPVPTVVSNHLILPYVGWSPVAPRMTPQPTEVAEVLEIPLTSLMAPSNVEEEIWDLRGHPYVVTFYRFGDAKIWGATGRVLSDLARRLDPVNLHFDYPPGGVRPVTKLDRSAATSRLPD